MSRRRRARRALRATPASCCAPRPTRRAAPPASPCRRWADVPRVLVISAAAIGEAMTGPAIRALEFARVLRAHADVTLAGVEPEQPAESPRADVVFRQQDPRPLREHVERADVIVAQPPWPLVAGWARRAGARLVYDLYDPEPLELLADLAEGGETHTSAIGRLLLAMSGTLTLDRTLTALGDGHHFLCASEKQRDLWIGVLLGERLIRDEVYGRDPSLRSVVEPAPFGVPSEPPRHSGSAGIRGAFPAIGGDDEIVLWNGGIWNWLDAVTPVRAMALLAERRPRARLAFMGHSADVSGRRAAAAARQAAAAAGLLDTSVFFNDRWVPYAERADWLLEADCAVSAHLEHLETRFAFRTRLLDCFLGGLPIVCPEGDARGARAARAARGAAGRAGAAGARAAALARVLDRGRIAYGDRLATAAAEHRWERVTEALVRFVTTTEPPHRLGAPPLAHPARWARTAGFRAARSTLNAVGLDRWPKV